MTLKRILLATSIAGAILAAGGAHAQDDRLLIGSTSASSSQYGYFVALAKLINDQVPGVDASVVETGATVDNLRRIERDQIDLGLVTTNVGQHAYAGQRDFEGRAIDNRLLWVYSIAPQNVVVRADAGVDGLSGLEGKRFNPGIRGSATEQTAESVFETLGIAPDFVRGSTTDIVDMIKDDRLIGYVKSGVGEKLDASTLDISTLTPVDVLSLTEEQAETLRTEMPDISVVDIPAGAGEGIPAYQTWSFGLAVHADPDLDEETAYQIVKAAMEDETVQANALADLRGADLTALTMEHGTVPLHPGAARYFQEQGVDIPENLAPQS